ncbi:hypothetical protein [Mycoplasmopsis cynos]|uniref:hypothetical protein n=1 Tax=Mycoplasmopsis cynos TaxID=171284 RepID=UPI0021FD6871|nr:hypothetical protein [Mycoplasmopsis cynos]UWV82486.1 hypothetical protein NW067_05925 [Mycoplasmopsis cynos]
MNITITKYFEINPFYNEKVSNIPGNKIALIIIGAIFIVIGLLFFLYYIKISIKKLREFKERQLQTYYNDNPKKTHSLYERTGLYIPSRERVKFNFPLFFGILVIFIGVAFIAGNTLSTL